MPQDTTFRFPALQTEVPLYEITVAPDALAQILASPREDIEAPATFTYQGKSQPVTLRLRGSSARDFPKKSWRIEFPKGVDFDGRGKFNLIAEYQDSTLMAEKLGYDLLRGMGVPAPKASYVRLSINGNYEGVYLDLERVDKDFLRNHGMDRDGTIYRCGSKDCEFKPWRADYQTDWEKETNESQPKDDIRALVDVINHTPEPDFIRVLGEHLDLENYLHTMVVDALIGNYIVEDSRSYIAQDKKTGRWVYVPWDLNNANSTWWPSYGLEQKPTVDHPLFNFSLTDAWVLDLYTRRTAQGETPGLLPTFSNLNTRIVFNPELRQRLVKLMGRGLDELYDPAVVLPRLDAMHALIEPYVAQDPYINRADAYRQDGMAQFEAGLPYLKKFVVQRTDFIRKQLKRFQGTAPAGLALSALDARAGWVELHNYGTTSVSTSGLVITKDLRRAMTANVPARTLAPGQTVRFTAAELGLTVTPNGPTVETGGAVGFPPEGELGLFDGKSIVGVLDVFFYGELPAGQSYARNAKSPDRWEVR